MGVRVAVVAATGVTDAVIGSTIIRNVSKTRTFCRQVAGTLASDVLDAVWAGVPW